MTAAPRQRRAFRGIWIPADLWLDRRISALGRILVAEIDSLSPTKRGCWASNAYLADLLGISERQLQRLLAEVEEAGWIERDMLDDPRLSGGRTRFLRVLHPPAAALSRRGSDTDDGEGDMNGSGGVSTDTTHPDTPTTPPLSEVTPPHVDHIGEHIERAVAAENHVHIAEQFAARLPAAAAPKLEPLGTGTAPLAQPAPAAAALKNEVPERGRKGGAVAAPVLSSRPAPVAGPAPAAAFWIREEDGQGSGGLMAVGAVMAGMREATPRSRDSRAEPVATVAERAGEGEVTPQRQNRPIDPADAETARAKLAAAGIDGDVEKELARRHPLARIEAVLRRAAREGKAGGWIVAALRRGWEGDPEPDPEPPDAEVRQAQAMRRDTERRMAETRQIEADRRLRTPEEKAAADEFLRQARAALFPGGRPAAGAGP